MLSDLWKILVPPEDEQDEMICDSTLSNYRPSNFDYSQNNPLPQTASISQTKTYFTRPRPRSFLDKIIDAVLIFRELVTDRPYDGYG